VFEHRPPIQTAVKNYSAVDSNKMSGMGTLDAREAVAVRSHVTAGVQELKPGMFGSRFSQEAASEEDIEGVSPPTEEELTTLRRVPAPIPWICFTVAFVELCERFAYYGTTAVSKSAPESDPLQGKCVISSGR